MTTAKRQTLADFLYYSMCEGQQEMGPIGYSPLPINLVQAGVRADRQAQGGRPGVDLTDAQRVTCHNPTFVAGQPSRNYLAEIAPKPPACDKAGAGPVRRHRASGQRQPGNGRLDDSSATASGSGTERRAARHAGRRGTATPRRPGARSTRHGPARRRRPTPARRRRRHRRRRPTWSSTGAGAGPTGVLVPSPSCSWSCPGARPGLYGRCRRRKAEPREPATPRAAVGASWRRSGCRRRRSLPVASTPARSSARADRQHQRRRPRPKTITREPPVDGAGRRGRPRERQGDGQPDQGPARPPGDRGHAGRAPSPTGGIVADQNSGDARRRSTRSSCCSAAASTRRRCRRPSSSTRRPAGRRPRRALPGRLQHVASRRGASTATRTAGRSARPRRRARPRCPRRLLRRRRSRRTGCRSSPRTAHVYARRSERLRRHGARGGQRRRARAAQQHDLRRHRRSTARAAPTSTSGPTRTTPRSAARRTVPCSLVVVPIMGISCDAAADLTLASGRPAAPATDAAKADAACRADRPLRSGQLVTPGTAPRTSRSAARSGGAASNWRNRITVPLTFAPVAQTSATSSARPRRSTCTAPSSSPRRPSSGRRRSAPTRSCSASSTCRPASPRPGTCSQPGRSTAAFVSDRRADGVLDRPVVHAPVAVYRLRHHLCRSTTPHGRRTDRAAS